MAKPLTLKAHSTQEQIESQYKYDLEGYMAGSKNVGRVNGLSMPIAKKLQI